MFQSHIIDQVVSKIPEFGKLFPDVTWNLIKGITNIYPQDELSSNVMNFANTIRRALKS